MLLAAPLMALLCSCGESIQIPEDSECLLPDHVVESILATTTESTTVITTTVTINPLWQEQAVGNYNGRNGVVIQGVPHYTQFTSYYTACESLASLTAAARSSAPLGGGFPKGGTAAAVPPLVPFQ